MSTATRKKSRSKLPSLRCCNNRGFVELNSRRIYLGAWGAPETERAYERTIAEWLANGRRVPIAQDELTIAELCAGYLRHCEGYYRQPDGTLSSSIEAVRQSMKPFVRLYASMPAAGFGPKALRCVRQGWIDAGLSRKTCNYYTATIKNMFKWGGSHELIPAGPYHALATVEQLRAGRSEAKERGPVESVPVSHVEAIRPHVSRQVWALVQLQLLTGARPGELLRLRPIDLDTSGNIWSTRLRRHKTAYRGKERVLYFGPRAQEVLREFLSNRPIDAFLFSPREAERERHSSASSHRRPGQRPNACRTDRCIGDSYTVDSYRRAVERGAKEAGVAHWTPHRLRHTAATLVRKEFGLDAAQVFLGHSHADVTQIYAEANAELGKTVVSKLG